MYNLMYKIREIYENHVKLSPEYFTKYRFLPECPVRAWNYSWKGHDMSRNFIILDFIEWIKKHNIEKGNNLAFTSSVDPELEFIDYENSYYMKYPPCDLHEYIFQLKDKFDFFVFNQTIDHLYNPFMAVENIYQYVKPGGYLYICIPFMQPIHNDPKDYRRYTSDGLIQLLEKYLYVR